MAGKKARAIVMPETYDGRRNSRRSTSGSRDSTVSRRSRRRNSPSRTTAGTAEPRQPDVAEGVVLDAGEEDAERRAPEQGGAQDVEPVVGGLGRRRQQPPRQSDDDDADRDVDEEHQPPAEGRPAERDQRAADERADRGAEPDRRTEDAEGAAAVVAAEHLLDQARRPAG